MNLDKNVLHYNYRQILGESTSVFWNHSLHKHSHFIRYIFHTLLFKLSINRNKIKNKKERLHNSL